MGAHLAFSAAELVKRGKGELCLPCTWQSQSIELLIMLVKKEKIDSRLKLRKSKKQDDHTRRSCSVRKSSRPGTSSKGVSMAQPSHHHHDPRHH